jgi:hypothetical protein
MPCIFSNIVGERSIIPNITAQSTNPAGGDAITAQARHSVKGISQ